MYNCCNCQWPLAWPGLLSCASVQSALHVTCELIYTITYCKATDTQHDIEFPRTCTLYSTALYCTCAHYMASGSPHTGFIINIIMVYGIAWRICVYIIQMVPGKLNSRAKFIMLNKGPNWHIY